MKKEVAVKARHREYRELALLPDSLHILVLLTSDTPDYLLSDLRCDGSMIPYVCVQNSHYLANLLGRNLFGLHS